MKSIKKLLILAMITAVVGLGVANAADKPVPANECQKTTVKQAPYSHAGKFGLGYQETFGTGQGFGTSLGEISAKVGLNKFLTVQALYGMDIQNKNKPKKYEVGGRLLVNLINKHNSVVYTGIGLGVIVPTDSSNIYRFNLPLGVEFSFAGLRELGFSAETGLVYDYTSSSGAVTLSTVGGNVGGALGMGVHYYF
jgi:hypothetical protein